LGVPKEGAAHSLFVTAAEDVEAAKVFNFVAYHAFIGFWNRECTSMERLGIEFDFDVNRLGGKRSPRVPLKRILCLSSRA
jgi:hypothetical protein